MFDFEVEPLIEESSSSISIASLRERGAVISGNFDSGFGLDAKMDGGGDDVDAAAAAAAGDGGDADRDDGAVVCVVILFLSGISTEKSWNDSRTFRVSLQSVHCNSNSSSH